MNLVHNNAMVQFENVTTRGGDSGQTSMMDGSRRPKDDLLMEALGDVDELHATLGLFKASLSNQLEKDEIDWIEQVLLRIGGMIAVPPSHSYYSKLDRVDSEDIHRLETWQKEMMETLKIPNHFITYGSTDSGAKADLARAVCRRAERRVVSLIRERMMRDLMDAQVFLNRLSDYLFVWGRKLDGC